MSSPTIVPVVLTDTLSKAHQFLHAQGVACYLVGGLLRDQLLERQFAHLNADLVVPRGAVTLAQALATHLHAAFVPLDETVGSARVVVTTSTERVELDLGDFRAASLEDDLRCRDFTVNAIAVKLSDWLRNPTQPAPLIDPLQGQTALRAKMLRACFPETFLEDPVRILRGFRFMVQLEMTLDPTTISSMRGATEYLLRISGERIRDELMAIFHTDCAHQAIAALNELGALDVLVPELRSGRGVTQGGYHHLDVLGHQLEAVAQADRILADLKEFSAPLREPLAAYCAERLVERRSRKSLIKLASLLHDVGKPARRTVEADGEIWFLGHEQTGAELTAPIVERLKLSNREAQMVCQLVLHHLRPGFLSREPQLTRRAIYRFFKDLGEHGPACALTWWADRMATRGPRSRLDQIDQQRRCVEELLNAYFFKAEEVVKPPRLIGGHQLMSILHLQPGPVVGTLLSVIEEAQAEGRIQTTEQALALAQQHLTTLQGKR